MSTDTSGKDKSTDASAAEQAEKKRALLDAEDWKDAPGEKTICEYHKDGLPDGVCEKREVDDLEYFSDYWKGRSQGTRRSEYHKEGAPYIEEPSEWEGHRPRRDFAAGKAASGPAPTGGGRQARAPDERPPPEGGGLLSDERQPEPAPKEGPGAAGTETEPPDQKARHESGRRALPPLERLIDIPSMELAAYAMFRSIIGHGIHIPIKREGVVDMDLIVKDRDVVLNTNQLQLELPSLAIWRIIFAYKGEAVVEYGRGVKNNIKIHRWRLFKLLLQMWWRGRQKARQVDQEGGA